MGTSESHLPGRKAPFPCNLRMSSSSFCNLYPTPWQKKMLWNAITSLSLLAIAAVVVFTLYVATQILAFLQPLLLPVAVSGVFAYLLEPVVSWLAKKKVPRLLAVIIVFGAFVLGAALLAVGVVPSLYTESVKFSSALPGYFDHFLNLPCSVLPMPEPNRGAQILERDDDTRKSICLGGVVRGAHFENHLVLLAKLERLNVASLAQIPNMRLMTISALQEFFGNDAVFDLVGRAPSLVNRVS